MVGGITRRRSSITGVVIGATTVATLTVCDFSSTVRVVLPTLEGNGRPGAFLAAAFFAAAFLTGAFFAGAFFAAAFLAGDFFATFFANFFAGAFLAAFFAGAFFAGGFLFCWHAAHLMRF